MEADKIWLVAVDPQHLAGPVHAPGPRRAAERTRNVGDAKLAACKSVEGVEIQRHDGNPNASRTLSRLVLRSPIWAMRAGVADERAEEGTINHGVTSPCSWWVFGGCGRRRL